MGARLTISPDLSLPLLWMSLSTVVYGARGSGKTTLGCVLAEELHAAGQRFCGIDLKGDMWGLKASADGKGGGIPVVVFGGEHADLPLEPDAGTEVANVVAALDQPSILDLEDLSKGKQLRFLGAFFERLYDANRSPLLLLMDEAQRYAPQRPMNPEATVCLGAVEDLVKLGRKHGIGPVLFTQRGSGLNKEVSELCDMLVAFRTPGPLDQDRIKDWLDANATREQRDEIMGRLAKLPTGTAIFASGHPDLDVFQVASVRRRDTFDSSATPAIGQRKREPKLLAQPDLEALKTKMAEAIERAKAEDPKELRKEIARLRAENQRLATRPTEKETVEVERRVEVPPPEIAGVISELVGMENSLTAIQRLRGHIVHVLTEAATRETSPTRMPEHPPQADHRPSTPPPTIRQPVVGPVELNGESLGRAERQILAALETHPDGLSRVQLAFLSGYSPRTSTLSVSLAKLRRMGLVSPGDPIRATPAAAGLADGVERLPEPGPALVAYWSAKLGRAEREILRVMVEAHPDELRRDEIAERTGYSPQTSTLSVALARLRGLKLVDGFRVSRDLVG